MAVSERNTLSGGPSNALVRRVRQVLRLYMQCRPPRDCPRWRQAWEWANRVRHRGDLFNFTRRPARWPMPNEIASQYLLICLLDMRESHQLRLPHHASETAPPALLARLRGGDLPLLSSLPPS